MLTQKDSSGQRFVEVETLSDERVRATYVPADKAGYRVDSVRIQIRDQSGHLRQGPEVPVAALGPLVAAFFELVMDKES